MDNLNKKQDINIKRRLITSVCFTTFEGALNIDIVNTVSDAGCGGGADAASFTKRKCGTDLFSAYE